MRLSHLLALAVVLIVLVGACSRDNVEQNPTPLADGASDDGDTLAMVNEDGEVVQIPRPAPEFIQFMLNQVEAGEITLEEGVINGLRVLAGEITLAEIYGDKEILFESGFILTGMAVELYRSTTDGEAKAEIARLMSIISPQQENLDLYAIPEEEAGARSPGLAAGRPLNSRGGVICESIWADGFPTGVEDPPICLLYRSFIVEGYEYRAYYPEENGGDEAYLGYVEAAVDALQETRAVYDPLSNIRSINLIFTLLPNSRAPRAVASVPGIEVSTHGVAPCPISVYPGNFLRFNVDEFKQAIAHEVFHCLHFFRLDHTAYVTGAWYSEGMAEYFSNVVYPTVNREHMWAQRFNINSAHAWLMDMSYENVVFFQYLGTRFGNTYLLDLMDVLAFPDNNDSKSEQAAALAGVSDMQSVFHEFGQAVLRKEITDTGGGEWPISLLYLEENYFDIREGRELLLSTAPFTLQRYVLTFEEGQSFEIARATDGAPSEDSWRPPLPGAFADIPSSYQTSCGARPERVVLLTSAPSSASEFTQSDLVLNFAPSIARPLDCCLVGTWEQGTDEIRRRTEILFGSIDNMRIVDLTGRFVLVVTEEGRTTWTPIEYSATVELQDSAGVRRGRVDVEGSSTGAITTPEEGVILSTSESTSLVETITLPEGTIVLPLEGDGLGGLSAGEFSYTCDENTLVVDTSGASPFESSALTRISAIPATPEPGEEFPVAPPELPDEPPDIGGESDFCSQVTFSGFATEGNNVVWSLANSGGPLSLSVMSLSWAEGNDNLQEISINGTTVWSGSRASPVYLSDGWSSELEARALPAGGGTLSLRFASVAASSEYGLTLLFEGGCRFVDVR